MSKAVFASSVYGVPQVIHVWDSKAHSAFLASLVCGGCQHSEVRIKSLRFSSFKRALGCSVVLSQEVQQRHNTSLLEAVPGLSCVIEPGSIRIVREAIWQKTSGNS